jgi:LysM repeat protein
MRLQSLSSIIVASLLAVPATASADYPHTVLPGESLSSIAAADGVTVSQLAVVNGLTSGSGLVTGTTVMIPPKGSSAGSYAGVTAPAAGVSGTATATTPTVSGGDRDEDSDDVGTTTVSTSTGEASITSAAGGGSYVVQPGDTLAAIAARAGMSVAQLAVDNGLDPNGVLLSGSVLRFGGGGGTVTGTAVPVSTTVSQTPSAEGQPVGAAAQGNATNPPYPTPERVSASEIGQIASANGVPPGLAEAIGWQESGFNNDLVSTADARGVMQILPGTWDWIQNTLAGSSLAPASAADNVRGGVLLLHSLLGSTGGSPSLAAAGYYQGLSSVQQHGMYPDTQQYVNSVLALEQHFGGG